MFDASEYLITVVELPGFSRTAGSMLTTEEIDGLIFYLAQHPDDGDVIPGTGGLRKMRWGARGKGKRGGARVIYYFRDLNMPLYLLTLFGKGERIDLSSSDKVKMSKLVDEIVSAHWEQRISPRIHKINRP